MSDSTRLQPAAARELVRGFDHLYLPTANLKAALAFWVDLLGAEMKHEWTGDDGHGGAALSLAGDFIVTAAEGEPTPTPSPSPTVGHDPSAGGDAPPTEFGYPATPGVPRLFLRVRDPAALRTLRDHLAAAGVPILREPGPTHWGPEAMSVRGPDGLVVCLLSPNPRETEERSPGSA